MKKLAFLFPGQGSQKVGMAQDVYREYDFVRDIFAAAEEAVQLDLSKMCFEGPIEDLTLTVNLQPAITAVNLAYLAPIIRAGIEPAYAAGHSLGEYSALYAARAVSLENTFRLVFKRGELMQREATRQQGAMTAIIGLTIDAVRDVVDRVRDEGVVSVANHNMDLQTVITGSPQAVARAASLASSQGAKAVELRVSGAWHSELIRGAEDDFSRFLGQIPFFPPQCPVIHNVSADTALTPETIRGVLARQLCSPVKWYDTMCRLIAEEVDAFVEIGPGKVLSGLLKKTLTESQPCPIFTVNNLKSMEKFLNAIV